MEQNYFSREQLLECIQLPIDHVDNQKAWNQIITNLKTSRFPTFNLYEVKELIRKVGSRGLYKAFQTYCKNFVAHDHSQIYEMICRLLPEYKGYLAVLSFKYASDDTVRDFFYKRVSHTTTSDDLLIEQIPILLLKNSKLNEKYADCALRRIKNLAQRTTVYTNLTEFLSSYAQTSLPLTLKTVETIMSAACNKSNFRLVMPLLCDLYIDYPGSRFEIVKSLLSVCQIFDHNRHWHLNDIKEVISFLILAHEEKDSALASTLTNLLFKALKDISYQPIEFVAPLINRFISIIRRHYQMTAIQSLNFHIDKESPLYKELNVLLAA